MVEDELLVSVVPSNEIAQQLDHRSLHLQQLFSTLQPLFHWEILHVHGDVVVDLEGRDEDFRHVESPRHVLVPSIRSAVLRFHFADLVNNINSAKNKKKKTPQPPPLRVEST